MAAWSSDPLGIIVEKGGAHYEARFKWLPRVGELIDLHSFKDQLDGHQHFRHQYEVVAVVHEMHDVDDRDPPHEGHHTVKVYVKRSNSPYLTP